MPYMFPFSFGTSGGEGSADNDEITLVNPPSPQSRVTNQICLPCSKSLFRRDAEDAVVLGTCDIASSLPCRRCRRHRYECEHVPQTARPLVNVLIYAKAQGSTFDVMGDLQTLYVEAAERAALSQETRTLHQLDREIALMERTAHDLRAGYYQRQDQLRRRMEQSRSAEEMPAVNGSAGSQIYMGYGIAHTNGTEQTNGVVHLEDVVGHQLEEGECIEAEGPLTNETGSGQVDDVEDGEIIEVRNGYTNGTSMNGVSS